MPANLTEDFLAGFNAQDEAIDNPHIWSSDCWLAYRAGAAFAKRGASAPTRAWKGRGFSINVDTAGGTRFVVRADARLAHFEVTRP